MPAVNPTSVDGVTQTNVKVVGEAPAVAVGTLYQTMAHSTGVLFENAVAQQQQASIIAQAAANQGVIQIYQAGASAPPGGSGVSDNLTALLTVLEAFGGKSTG